MTTFLKSIPNIGESNITDQIFRLVVTKQLILLNTKLFPSLHYLPPAYHSSIPQLEINYGSLMHMHACMEHYDPNTWLYSAAPSRMTFLACKQTIRFADDFHENDNSQLK